MSGAVPALRFPEFSGAWAKRKLADVARVTSGGTPNREKSAYWHGSIPWVTTSEIKGQKISETSQMITELGLANSSAKMFPENTVLLAMYGQGQTRGRVAMLAIAAATNQACAAIIPTPELAPEFFFYDMTRRYEELRDLANDGSQKNLSGGLIKGLKIILPTLPEQQKIAAFLGAVDGRLAGLRRAEAGLVRFKAGLMQRLFSQKLRFKQDDGSAFPDWEEKRLGEIGVAFSGLSGKSGEDFGTGLPFITYRQIFESSVIDENRFEFVEILHNERQNRVLKGDVLITTSSETPNEVGFSSVLLNDIDELYLNSFSFGYRFEHTSILPDFAVYLFRSPLYRKAVVLLAQGSTRYNISKSGFLAIRLWMPHPDEQRKIAAALSALDAKITATRAQITQTERFKQGLLQQMFV